MTSRMHVDRRKHKTFGLDNLKKIDHSEELSVDEMIILKWTASKSGGRV